MRGQRGVSPTSAEVEAHILRAQERHPRSVSVEDVLHTAEGRPIYAVTVTDRSVPDRFKQNVLIVAGQHGNEESGRLIALALIDWLVTGEAAETRRRQKVVVMPNVSPDAAERDAHLPPSGMAPNLDHGFDGPTTPEGRAVERVARELAPEVFVDVHARGYAGCSYDMVLYPKTRVYTEDESLLQQLAREMADAGEKASIPHVVYPLTWPGWGGDDPKEPSTTLFAYRNFKSIVFLTETSEDNLHAWPARDRVRAGLARVKTLLAWGNRRHPKLPWRGYPCLLAGGMFHRGLVAVGADAAARRRSRLAIWRNVARFKRFELENPEPPCEKRFAVEYDGEPLPHGIGFQIRARGQLRVREARLNGRRLRRSQADGYWSWHDACSTFVLIVVPQLAPGTYHGEVAFR